MRIGFLDNQICERGSTWQALLYAKYSQMYLGHSAKILYPTSRYVANESALTRMKWTALAPFLPRYRQKFEIEFDQKMADKIVRYGIDLVQVDLNGDFSQFDAIHHFKLGPDDGFRPKGKGTRYWVHAVSRAEQPHGDRFAAVSAWLGRRDKAPVVPNLVECAEDTGNLRKQLGIPADGIVFARYGGRSTFDIPWVWDAIAQSLERLKNVFFVFANTDVKLRHERVFDLPTMYDGEVSLEIQKRRFVNTCNVMLHARGLGETFGIAVGEFAVCGKPILTYGKSPERSHIEMLRNPVFYNDVPDLVRAIERIASGDVPLEDGGAYRDCTGEKVMKIFDQVFIR